MLCFYSDWEAEAVSPDFWTSCRHMVAEAYGPEVDALLAEVEARYPAGTRSVLASDVQLHHQPGGPQLSDLVEALMAGVDWSRDFGTDVPTRAILTRRIRSRCTASRMAGPVFCWPSSAPDTRWTRRLSRP